MRGALLVALVLAGCAAPAATLDVPAREAEGRLDFSAPVDVARCTGGRCFEPSVAVDPLGRVFVTDASARLHARLRPELPFVALSPPAVPGASIGGDGHVQVDPLGRLWLSSLARTRGGDDADAVWLARSDDGGLTWPLNAVHALPGRVDRQWLVFPEGELILTYNDLDAGIRAATSTDDGATLGEAALLAPGAHVHGQGVAARDGRVLVPYFDYGSAPAFRLAVREAGAWTVDTLVGPPGEFFPALAETADGFVAAWRGAEEELLVATSSDARAWTAPERWSIEGERLVASPWLASGGSLAVVWPSTRGAPEVGHHAARLVDGRLFAGTAREGLVAPLDARAARTDFAHVATGNAGELLVVWVEDEDALRLAVHQG